MSGYDPFQVLLKARYCLAAIVVSWHWQPARELVVRLVPYPGWYWPNIVYHYYAHAVAALFLAAVVLASRLDIVRLLGRAPGRGDIATILFATALAYCGAFAIDILSVIPLSYVFPQFVTWWLAWWSQPMVYMAVDGTFPVGPNVLGFVSLVILAPVLEELLFRGYLLNRWARKWGLGAGVLLSSAVFGAVHPDPVAIAFCGLIFAALYLKMQSLWAPIIAHGLFNLISWLWFFYDIAGQGFDYYIYTIDELREDFWIGAGALIIALVLVDRLLRRKAPVGPFVLPSQGQWSREPAPREESGGTP